MIGMRREGGGLPMRGLPMLAALAVSFAATSGGIRTSPVLAGDDAASAARAPGPRTVTETLPGGVPLELAAIEPGEFLMGAVPGDAEAEAREKPQHAVTIARPFLIGVHEITQSQWQAVMGTTLRQQRAIMDPAHPQRGLLRGEGPDHPMYYVRWDDARTFCRKLSELTGRSYRLPSEAEWEYACRAGRATKYAWGDDFDGRYAWYEGNSGGLLHPVGQKPPNGWGLFDMAGNAHEWCAGYFHAYAANEAADRESRAGGYHALRGGSFGCGRANMRASHRFRAGDGHFIGFRVVRDAE